MWGRSAECPGPHGDQAGGWYSELNGRGGPERTGGCVGVQEFTNVWRGEVVEGLEGEEQNLEMNGGFDQEPVKLLKDRSDVINGGGSGDDASGRVMDQLKLTDGLEGDTKEEGVTVIDAGSDQGVNKDGCAMGCEGWAEAVDVA